MLAGQNRVFAGPQTTSRSGRDQNRARKQALVFCPPLLWKAFGDVKQRVRERKGVFQAVLRVQEPALRRHLLVDVFDSKSTAYDRFCHLSFFLEGEKKKRCSSLSASVASTLNLHHILLHMYSCTNLTLTTTTARCTKVVWWGYVLHCICVVMLKCMASP